MNLCEMKKTEYFRYLVSQYVLLLALKIDNWEKWFVEVILKEFKR